MSSTSGGPPGATFPRGQDRKNGGRGNKANNPKDKSRLYGRDNKKPVPSHQRKKRDDGDGRSDKKSSHPYRSDPERKQRNDGSSNRDKGSQMTWPRRPLPSRQTLTPTS